MRALYCIMSYFNKEVQRMDYEEKRVVVRLTQFSFHFRV